jgi:lipopolysaccharide transport system ATP-binding protein
VALGPISISAEGVGKRYQLGEARRFNYSLLSDRIGAALRSPGRLLRRGGQEDERAVLWALKDVSFDLHRGEALGLIGRNGAGKSTLLKLVSRITLPTEGRITTFGRVATLLEVGTGFHPEIVEFSGIPQFLDTPVKRYSSGMYVRLAFAVAAHLDPEIMLVDEVLAVGDAEFQKKCLSKMRDVAGGGRAVIFVSHNLPAVQRLCSRALLIEGGRLQMDGRPGEVVGEYLDRIEPEQSGGVAVIDPDAPREGLGGARATKVAMTDLEGRPLKSLHLGQPFRVTATFDVETPMDAAVEIGISTAEGRRIVTAQNVDGERPFYRFEPGERQVSAELQLTLLPGEYAIDIGVNSSAGTLVDMVDRVIRFTALNEAETGGDHWRWIRVRGHVRPASSVWSEVSSVEDVASLAAHDL